MVYLIGAGPGDIGLLTVKARQILECADVILYDRLANPLLLTLAPPDCEIIDVGKQPGKHRKTQEETTALLVEKGAQSLTVVRLKGGDPFLFGRGGEEAEELAAHNIPFEIVPGISALLAATAYAGIPLTHRGHASSFAAATGHGAQGKDEDPVRWGKLADAADTIIVFMGVKTMAETTAEMIRGGRDAATPAAVIEKGATPSQRVVAGDLGTIADIAEEHDIQPPSLLIIGSTVSLRQKLDWYNPGTLAGLRIAVTRPAGQAESMNEKLMRFGAEPVPMPSIEIQFTIGTDDVQKALGHLDKYDAVLFFSVNGVKSFAEALKNRGEDMRRLAGIMTGAIGPATADALDSCGIRADIKAETYIAEGLLEAVTGAMNVAGKSMLLVRSDKGRATTADGLRDAGASVDNIVFYKTAPARYNSYMKQLAGSGVLDMVTFTSSSTVNGFFENIPPDTVRGRVKIASIGPQTSKAVESFGLTPDVTASEYTSDGLVDAICEYYRNTKG